MARTDQQQIRQHRNAERLLDTLLICTDLVLPQPEVCLQFPIDLLSVPLRRPLYTQVLRRLLR